MVSDQRLTYLLIQSKKCSFEIGTLCVHICLNSFQYVSRDVNFIYDKSAIKSHESQTVI